MGLRASVVRLLLAQQQIQKHQSTAQKTEPESETVPQKDSIEISLRGLAVLPDGSTKRFDA